MKRLITTLLILSSFAGGAQSYQYLTNPGMTGRIRGNWLQDSAQFFNLTVKPTVPTYFQSKGGFIVVGDSVFRWSPSAHNWVAMTSAGSPVWGTITGTLSSQTDLQAVLNAKQNKLPAGTTSQYYDGTLALRNFRTEVNANIDTFYVSTRARLKKVIDSIINSTSFTDPYGVISATVTQPTVYSKLLTINRVNGTSITASWQDTSASTTVIGALIDSQYALKSAFYDTATAHRLRMDSMGWVAIGPYLIGHPAQNVGDRYSAEVSETALRTLIESYMSDGSVVTGPDLSIDSVTVRGATPVTGGYQRTLYIYRSSGRIDSSIYVDYVGSGGPIYTENDPVWTAASVNYYTKTNLQTSGQALVHWGNITNAPAFLTNITGLVTAGTNTSVTGSGTAASPYVVSVTGTPLTTTDPNLSISGTTISTRTAWNRQTVTGTYSIDISQATGYNNHVLTLSGNTTLSITGTPQDGQIIAIHLKQDATGSRTVTWPSSVDWSGTTSESAPTLKTGGGKRNVITLQYNSTDAKWYGYY